MLQGLLTVCTGAKEHFPEPTNLELRAYEDHEEEGNIILTLHVVPRTPCSEPSEIMKLRDKIEALSEECKDSCSSPDGGYLLIIPFRP